MKKKLKQNWWLLFAVFITILWGSCKKDTTPSALQIQKPNVYSSAYYAALRAYKASDHARCFIWLSDYGFKGVSASLGERFAGVPDSVDIISLWGGVPDPIKNSNDYKEMRFIQKTKGTKLLAVNFVDINSYPPNDSGIMQMIENIKQQVYNYDLDGMDLDYEPDSFYSNPDNFIKLIVGLSQFLGPKSGTGKILDIDYYLASPPSILSDYVDFVVQQDYGASSYQVLQSSFDYIAPAYSPKQYFATENMGDYWQTGGVAYTDSAGTTMNSLLGFAKWNPSEGRKGGFGAFFAQRDYYNPVAYGYLRAAIQACNPHK